MTSRWIGFFALLCALSGCKRDEAAKAEPVASAPKPGAMARPVVDEPTPVASATPAASTAGPTTHGPCKSVGKVMTRHNLAMVKLPDGRVLIIGGGLHDQGDAQTAVDVVDPDKLTVEPFAPLNIGRILARAAALPDGRVVVAHGFTETKGGAPSAEIYDPASKRWRLIRGLGKNEAMLPLVAPLPGGKVLIAGGDLAWKGAMLSDSFVLDATSGKLTRTDPLPESGAQGGFYRLDKGKVIWAANGYEDQGIPTNLDCDLSFDPETRSWTSLKTCRPATNEATRYPDASGKTSFFGYRANGIWKYEKGAWKEAHTFPDKSPGASLFDALGIDAHRLVGLDGNTGDVMVCSL